MLTKQQIFNIAVSGLLKQGKKAQNQSDNCLYRGPNGTKCGVGMLIKDEVYNPDIEKQDCANPSVLLKEVLIKSGVDINCLITRHLLIDIQNIHDMENVECWPVKFQELATEHTLDPLVITEFLFSSLVTVTRTARLTT